jgi:NDP-sugar pyrophosphorylase family protein
MSLENYQPLGDEKTIKPEEIEQARERHEDFLSKTTVYINAGGEGTRLRDVIGNDEVVGGYDGQRVTKALLKFGKEGKPLIEHQLELIKELGFKGAIVGAGNHYNIPDYLESREGLLDKVEIINTDVQEDTGGDLIKALRQAKNPGEYVLVANVDTLINIDNPQDLLEQHISKGAVATIVLTSLKNVPNAGAFLVDDSGRVVFTRESRDQDLTFDQENWTGKRASSTGVVVLNTQAIIDYPWQTGDKPLSIYKDMLPRLIQSESLYAYDNGQNLFTDVGTAEPYSQVKRHGEGLLGALRNRYLKNKNKV